MQSSIRANIDWPSFLSRHDLLWQTKPVRWGEGAFLGNGLLGVMVYGEEHRDKRHVLRFVLGRTDVTASRKGAFPVRVPIGELAIELEGWIYQPCEIRIDLWNAELRASLPTTKGHANIRALIHASAPVVLVEMDTDKGERGARIEWYAYPEVNPILKNADGINLNQYIPDITVERKEVGGVCVGIQAYGQGEGCTTAWKMVGRKADEVPEEGAGNQSLLCLLTVAGGISEADEAAARLELDRIDSSAAGLSSWIAAHRSWWHEYYPASFVSVPDMQLEGFYWVQMYKLASATRKEHLPIDNQGPWMTSTPWPGLWFNMNVQMSYSPVYAANRLELGESLIRSLRLHQEQLIRNVAAPYRSDSAGLGRSSSYGLDSPVENETGNLTWLMHNCWRQYRYSMDEDLLRDFVYPMLRRSVCLYMHLLEEGEDGLLHLPATVSPEYGSFKQMTSRDTHYDLALLRWGLETLLYAAERLEREEPLRERWLDILTRLAPLPIDETGYRIGRDLSLEFGHRHFSHLMAVFPLHIAGEAEEDKKLALQTLRPWIAMEGDLRGFSFTGAASIAAALGLGNEALDYLRALMHLILPNTMYAEAGPVIETPLAGAEAIHDMLLQSWGGRIRVFPAVPDAWADASFDDLRAEGGFLVSAVRHAGKIRMIRLRSLAGEPCLLEADLASSEHEIRIEVDGRQADYLMYDDRSIELALAAGEEALILVAGDPIPDLEPVRSGSSLGNLFGGKKPWRLYGFPK